MTGHTLGILSGFSPITHFCLSIPRQGRAVPDISNQLLFVEYAYAPSIIGLLCHLTQYFISHGPYDLVGSAMQGIVLPFNELNIVSSSENTLRG